MNAPDIDPSKLSRRIVNLEPPAALTSVLDHWSGLFEMEMEMRRIILAAVATLSVTVGAALVPQSAEAMTVPAAAGIAAATQSNNLAQDVAYVCRRVWRCGPYGCGWRRACYWTGPRHYWGPRWRGRHWRRWHRW